MLTTLHKYIFREMSKTFLLSTIGLTAVLTTCGGLYNMTQLTNVSPEHTLKLLVLVVPMCASMTLPIAALFSAAATYGRLASDSEFIACRSTGINSHVLLAPCIVISIASAATTFAVFNLVIPRFVKQLHQVVRQDIKEFAVRTLQDGGRMEFQGQMITAAEVVSLSDDDPNVSSDAVVVSDVVFLVEDGDEFTRVGVAPSAAVKFDMSRRHPQIKAELNGLQVLDLTGEGRYSRHERELLGPLELKAGLRMRPKYLYMGELYKYRDQPELVIDKLQKEIAATRQLVMGKLTLDHFYALFSKAARCHLSGQDLQVDISASDPQVVADNMMAGRRWLELSNIQLNEALENTRLEYTAEHGRLELRFEDDGPPQLVITLNNGTLKRLDGGETQQFRIRELDPLDLPEVINTAMATQYPDEVLWGKGELPEFGADVDKQRKRLRKRRRRYVHEFYSEIHLRTVFSVSVVFLAVLGAALSVIFRGGQLLVAFGISFLPTLGVILTTILGKGIAKSVLVPGLSIMWGGLIAVIILDIVILKKYYPR